MWVRGLKLFRRHRHNSVNGVAPYVGAWIETKDKQQLKIIFRVAPYVGAWIETFGLAGLANVVKVAPYVGAWIETYH